MNSRTITMSVREVERVRIIGDLTEKLFKEKEAALALSLSVRQVRRLKSDFIREGPAGLVHKLRGERSNRRITDKEREKIKNLIEKKYPDLGPKFTWEKLSENENVSFSKETVRRIMMENNLWSSKKKKAHHREWRERKECLGEMIQTDGSDHDWFEGRNKKIKRCTLLAHIDDATGRLMQAVFARNESLSEVFKVTKKYLLTFGKPLAIYLDRDSIYKKNQKSMLDKESLTQFERAMEELRVKMIHAYSPQAKGRVERLFGTLQDRLIKEMRLRNINSIEEANQFLEDFFIDDFNRRFAVEPRSRANLHRKIDRRKEDLDRILSKQEQRYIANDFTIQFEKKLFQLEKVQPTLVLRNDKVVVEERMDAEIKVRLRNKYLNFHQIYLKPRKEPLPITALDRTPQRTVYIPPRNHPWRRLNFPKKRTFLLSQK